MNSDVIKQVAALSKMDLKDLRLLWKEMFKEPAHSRNSKSYLVKWLAYRIQEMAYGGLSETAAQRLEALAFGNKKNQNILHTGHPSQDIPASGARLVREWKGIEHVVTILPNGFEYQGRKFRSLSAVANHITGSKWNGKVFFGLKKQVVQTQEATK